MEEGVLSGVLAYEAVVEWSRDNAERLMETVRTARVETVQMGMTPSGEVAIETEYEADPEPVDYLISQGQGDDREIIEVTGAQIMKTPVATLTRDRPWAYVVPRDASSAIELLKRHAVTVERLQEDTEVSVSGYTISDISYERAYNHAASTRVHVEDVVTRQETLPEGTYIVRMGQMQGRVIAHLLEPESTDGVVYWNHMDAWLPKPEVAAFRAGEGDAPLFPILKLMEPTPLSTLMLPH